jgi:hypothetical protein
MLPTPPSLLLCVCRNIDGGMKAADVTILGRTPACQGLSPMERRRVMIEKRGAPAKKAYCQHRKAAL